MVSRELPLKTIAGIPITFTYDESILKILVYLYSKLDEVSLKYTRAEEAYYSCTIEGAISSVADSLKLLSGIKIPSNHSEQMIYNYLKLYNNPLGKQLFEDINKIREVWDILSYRAIDNFDTGYPFRNEPVYIISNGIKIHEGLKSTLLEHYLQNLYNYLKTGSDNVIIKSIILHFCFEHWHPFCDCNGRTGRYISTEYIICNGLDKFMALPINTVIYRDRQNYYNTLRMSDGNADITSFIEYMLSVYIISLYMAVFINQDNMLGIFLRQQKSYIFGNVTSEIMYELMSNNLLQQRNIFKPLLYKAIQIYNRNMD